MKKSEIVQFRKLKRKYEKDRIHKAKCIIAGQDVARKHGKHIGRLSKWDNDKNFKRAVKLAESVASKAMSLKSCAEKYKVPYYALYYHVRRKNKA